MPARIDDEDVLERLCLVEGGEYREQQERLEADENPRYRAQSVWGWRRAWEVQRDDDPDMRYRGVVNRAAGNLGSLYGYDGWNRYIVTLGGELFFHEGFAEFDDDCERARTAGFQLWLEASDTRRGARYPACKTGTTKE